MNRIHVVFADNGGLAKVPLIVPEGQGGEPYVPETVQAAARVLLADQAAITHFAIMVMRNNRPKNGKRPGYQPSIEAALRQMIYDADEASALAQEDTE
jgi:hypothetical protein